MYLTKTGNWAYLQRIWKYILNFIENEVIAGQGLKFNVAFLQGSHLEKCIIMCDRVQTHFPFRSLIQIQRSLSWEIPFWEASLCWETVPDWLFYITMFDIPLLKDHLQFKTILCCFGISVKSTICLPMSQTIGLPLFSHPVSYNSRHLMIFGRFVTVKVRV